MLASMARAQNRVPRAEVLGLRGWLRSTTKRLAVAGAALYLEWSCNGNERSDEGCEGGRHREPALGENLDWCVEAWLMAAASSS